MVKKNVMYHTIIHSFDGAWKESLADVICYCKMRSVMALVDKMLFLTLERRYK